MFHSYFYTPFMDASCARYQSYQHFYTAYNLMRLYTHVELSGKERLRCKKCYLHGKQSWNSLSTCIQCQSGGFVYRSNSLLFISWKVRYLWWHYKTVEYYVHDCPLCKKQIEILISQCSYVEINSKNFVRDFYYFKKKNLRIRLEPKYEFIDHRNGIMIWKSQS